jgi:hypothetical protein
MTIERPTFPPRAESLDSFSLQPAIGTEQREKDCRLSESCKPAERLSRLVLAGVADGDGGQEIEPDHARAPGDLQKSNSIRRAAGPRSDRRLM